MSRASLVLNVLLVLVVVVLAWALYARTGDTHAHERMSAAGSGWPTASASELDADAADRLSGQLARIDARLAALETVASRGGVIAPAAPPAAPEMSAAAADRRLEQLMPHRQIDYRELAEFHLGLAALPKTEQFALSAALSRAVNEDRIRMRP